MKKNETVENAADPTLPKASERGKTTVQQNAYAELVALDQSKERCNIEVFCDAEYPEQTYVSGTFKDGKSWAYPIDSKRLHDLIRILAKPDDVTPAVVKKWLRDQSHMAMFKGKHKRLSVRSARAGDALYIDLGDTDGQYVKIANGSWEIVGSTPEKFYRPSGFRSLPVPETGGEIEELWDFLNVGTQHERLLLMCWMLAAMLPDGPYPVLFVNGEYGSAKSTLVRLMRQLVDPSGADLRTIPRNEKELLKVAQHSRVLAFDNLSSLTRSMSDALCRISTGSGLAAESSACLYEETLMTVMRPIVFNGIEEIVLEPDLLDRAISITLPHIPTDERRTEAELMKSFNAAKPRLFGALLTVLAKALHAKASLEIEHLPRMADFGMLGAAVTQALGHPAEYFTTVLEATRRDNDTMVIEACPTGRGIWHWASHVVTGGRVLEGRPSKVFKHIQMNMTEDIAVTASQFSNRLRQIAPNLRRKGIKVDFSRTADARWIRLELTRKLTSEELDDAQPGLHVKLKKPDNDEDLPSYVEHAKAFEPTLDDGNDGNDADDSHGEPGSDSVDKECNADEGSDANDGIDADVSEDRVGVPAEFKVTEQSQQD